MPNNLTPAEIEARIAATGEPLAYIEGFAYFYGHKFIVDKSVLVPRPESETLVQSLDISSEGRPQLRRGQSDEARDDGPEERSEEVLSKIVQVLDLCTGSGCVGISIKLENPNLSITCSDISKEALTVAKQNAEALGAEVNFIQSDLFDQIPGKFDIIVTNPPYVDRNWGWLDHKSLDHEPAQALYAEDHGLAIIKRILKQAKTHLSPDGILLLECDPTQHQAVIDYASKHTFTHTGTTGYVLQFK